MSVPIVLPVGVVLVYGWGNDNSQSGIIPFKQDYKFGNVYQIWNGGEVFIYGGTEVMWKDGTELARLTYAGNPYTQLPARLVTKQIIEVV